MAKMPFFQFYPLDWLRDTRRLSPQAKAAWIDILCIAWNEPERGVYKRWHDEAARELGLEWCKQTEEEDDNDDWCAYHSVLLELDDICIVRNDKGEVRIESRRMVREEKERNLNAKYQDRFRSKTKVRSNVRDSKEEVRDKKLDVRSHKLLTANDVYARERDLPAPEASAKRSAEEIKRSAAEKMAALKRQFESVQKSNVSNDDDDFEMASPMDNGDFQMPSGKPAT